MSTLAGHRREYAYCVACPKLCRFSCPVAEAERRETVTPWGKMSVGHQVLIGARALDASSVGAAYACAGCMRCTEHCRHDNQVATALVAVRAEAVRQGGAPEAVLAVARRFRLYQSPFAASLSGAAERAGAAEGGRYFPGCTALVKDPPLVGHAGAAAKALGAELGVSPMARRCCGYPLYAAGLLDAFRTHAQAFALAAAEAPPLVVGDPGCAYTLLRAYPEVGVEAPSVKLWVDEMVARLPSVPQGKPLAIEVGYHDPCHLGRGLGRYEAPRTLLNVALGGAPFAESPESREDAGCSGGGGLLPRTHPQTAREVASRQAQAIGSADMTLVTACPAARRMFERAGAKVMALETALARFLQVAPR